MSEEKKLSIRDAYAAWKKNPELNSDKLLAALNNYKNTWEQERKQKCDGQWRQNLSFYSGNQNIRDRYRGNSQPYRVNVRENHTNNTVNRMLAIFVENLPICRVFSEGGTDQDARNAENTEAYGKYYYRTKKIEMKFIKLIKFSIIFGNAYVLPSWNPDLGDRLMLGDPDLGSKGQKKKYYRGDIQFEVDNPFRVSFRPGIDEMDDMYDFVRAVPVNKAYLEEAFGEIEAEPVSMLNASDNSIREDSEMVMQNHYFHKPTPWFEEGLYCSWAGKKLFRVRPASKSEMQLPIIHLPFDKLPMSIYGMSSIEQVMDLQEQLNRAASMIIEARNLVARPRVLAAAEAQIPGQSLSDRPGEIIKYKAAGGPPRFEVPNFNFAEMQNHKGDLRNAMQDIMGLTSASRGDVPAAIKTALGLQLVLQQDRSQYVPFIKGINQAVLDSFSGIFRLAAENLSEDDPRVIKIEGAGTDRTFHGGMVPSPLDIYLEDTNPLGWTAGARIEQVGNLIDKGVVKDQAMILDMLKLTNTDPAYKYKMVHKNAAVRENEDLKRGIPLNVGPEDDDKIHLESHVPLIASYEYRNYPKAVQDSLLMHAKQHEYFLTNPNADRTVWPPAPPEPQQIPGGAPGGMPGAPGPMPGPGAPQGMPGELNVKSSGGLTPPQQGAALQPPVANESIQGLLQQ